MFGKFWRAALPLIKWDTEEAEVQEEFLTWSSLRRVAWTAVLDSTEPAPRRAKVLSLTRHADQSELLTIRTLLSTRVLTRTSFQSFTHPFTSWTFHPYNVHCTLKLFLFYHFEWSSLVSGLSNHGSLPRWWRGTPCLDAQHTPHLVTRHTRSDCSSSRMLEIPPPFSFGRVGRL